MKSAEKNHDKDLYRRWRTFSLDQLWKVEIPRFDSAEAHQRIESVSLIRAVGVVFSESGTAEQKQAARNWLVKLLGDSNEKIRRYAIAALPKIGAGAREETELLKLFHEATSETEQKFLWEALEKIGGQTALEKLKSFQKSPARSEQKIRANLARAENPSQIALDRTLTDFATVSISLHCRKGLEEILRDETKEKLLDKFRIERILPGRVIVKALAPFRLADLYQLRCFDEIGFQLSGETTLKHGKSVDELAALITSQTARRIFEAFTAGSIRYRLEFVSRGHQRSIVRQTASRAYELAPDILNDPRSAPWEITVESADTTGLVELRPKLTEPRFTYRIGDVPAASHPPLAAALARAAGGMENEIVWDPFCGSGVELIERALLGGVREIYGTDLSGDAIEVATKNFAAANLPSISAKFLHCDFRKFTSEKDAPAKGVSLIITNPPLGKRVPIPNLRGLLEDLFSAATATLRPGGRLVFVNPFRMESRRPLLKLQSRKLIDLGGLQCWLEKYLKVS
jgi:23S rRNA G2445 N2-methylase RlmL